LIGVGVVGPGRAGLGLALALTEAGYGVRLHGRRGKEVPPPLSLSWGGPPPWLAEVEVVILAVKDDAIADAARDLAAAGGIGGAHTVLHLSGLLDETPLAALRGTGAALGCLHPLQAIARPEVAADRLRGAIAALTGDARAVAVGRTLAERLGMRAVEVAPAAKVRYHAAAAIASNYLVVLTAVAERLMLEAGIEPDAAREGVATLMRGTLANAREAGAAALTGPIVRGDVETVRAHLRVLPSELKVIYRSLGHAALALARLEGDVAAKMRRVLDADG
jgi:predicted short-subunit dehydrogenase-like oxidoreductase (DUF2520 family)